MIYPHQKTMLRALGAYDPAPTDKRTKAKAARRANIRRMQIERHKRRKAVKDDVWKRLERNLRALRKTVRGTEEVMGDMGRNFRKLARYIDGYHYGGTFSGRPARAPSPVGLISQARTEAYAAREKVVAISTPGTDFSGVERRISIRLHDAFRGLPGELTRKPKEG